MIVPNIASDISKAATGSIYALLLIAMMVAMPDGLGGLLAKLYRRFAGPGRPSAPGAKPARTS